MNESVDTPASLPSCNRWHPSQPSDIHLVHGVGARGTPFQRRHCAVCRGLYAQRRHQRDTRALPVRPYGLALGVVRLGWKVPELLTT